MDTTVHSTNATFGHACFVTQHSCLYLKPGVSFSYCVDKLTQSSMLRDSQSACINARDITQSKSRVFDIPVLLRLGIMELIGQEIYIDHQLQPFESALSCGFLHSNGLSSALRAMIKACAHIKRAFSPSLRPSVLNLIISKSSCLD
jgi:hypothetical protein